MKWNISFREPSVCPKNGFTLVLLDCVKTIGSVLFTSTKCAVGADSLLDVSGTDE